MKVARYRQEMTLDSPLLKSTISLAALELGHILGAALWCICVDAKDLVYAPQFNHRKDRFLNPTSLPSINRPALLITDAYSAMVSWLCTSNIDPPLHIPYIHCYVYNCIEGPGFL